MEIIFYSKIILIITLALFMLVALRLSAHSTVSMGLLATSVITTSIVLALVVFDDLKFVAFNLDIALALLLFGFVGLIAFTTVMWGSD